MAVGPRILITNDDGVDAPGIAVMQAIAGEISDDVWVVAPDSNQSGAGHRFTFGHELSLVRRGHNIYSLKGSPADCVVAGCTHLLAEFKPEIVLSGVNQGQNLGDVIHCSGTVAGAREGALQGALGIAMSQAVDFEREHDVDWTCAADFGAEIVRGLLREHDGSDVFYNINFPMMLESGVPDVKLAEHQRFSSSPFRFYKSRTAGKFFVAIPETPMPLDREQDFHIVQQDRAVTVTPLRLQQTDMEVVDRLQGRIGLRHKVTQ